MTGDTSFYVSWTDAVRKTPEGSEIMCTGYTAAFLAVNGSVVAVVAVENDDPFSEEPDRFELIPYDLLKIKGRFYG